MSDWKLFRGTHEPHDAIRNLPAPPSWRDFTRDVPPGPTFDPEPVAPESRDARRGRAHQPGPEEVELVNAALYLRRPLLLTGKPGTGKSSLAYAVAYELKLGPVLHWPITSRTTLAQGLYRYDAIGRLQQASLPGGDKERLDIGRFVQLGPLGTSLLPSTRPRVLLVDEIDKGDIDLPNDLLHSFEEGEFEIPELARLPEDQKTVEVLPYVGTTPVAITRGRVRCRAFPLVILTNNGEREFPAPFLRRCLRLNLVEPDAERLATIVDAHFADEPPDAASRRDRRVLIENFLSRRHKDALATDQLLNVIYLMTRQDSPDGDDRTRLIEALLRSLAQADSP